MTIFDFYTDPHPTEGSYCVVMGMMRKEWTDKKEKVSYVTMDAITLQAQFRGGKFYGIQGNTPIFSRVDKNGAPVRDQVKWMYHPTHMFETNTDPDKEVVANGFEAISKP